MCSCVDTADEAYFGDSAYNVYDLFGSGLTKVGLFMRESF